MISRNKPWVAGAVLLLAFGLFCQWHFRQSGDRNWLLFVAQDFYAGRRLYTDILTLLPPMIIWFYQIPVAAAAPLQADVLGALTVFGTTLAFFSLWCCLRLLRCHPLIQDGSGKKQQMTLTLGFMFFVWTNPMYFADRENLFLILTLPYILRFLPSLSARLTLSRPETLLISAMAAIGFCMKPYCAILYLAVVGACIIEQRSFKATFRPEHMIVAAGGLSYLLFIAVHYPLYYQLIMPMALATYSVNTDRGSLLYSSIAVVVFGVSFADFPWRQATPLRRDIFYLIGICAAWALYALSNNGWGYSWSPLFSMLLFTTVWVIWNHRFLQTTSQNPPLVKKLRQGIIACKANILVNTALSVTFCIMSLTTTCPSDCTLVSDLEEVAQQAQAKSFGTISMDFLNWTSMSRATNTVWLTRISQIWMLPKFFISDDHFREQHQWILDYVTQSYADDLNENKPDLMFVDDTDTFYKIYHPVDLLAFLSRDSRFKEAWSHYRFYRSVDHCKPPKAGKKKVKNGCKYDAYRRVEP